MRDVKQVIVIRRDLKMRRGKECAQASHASMAFITRQLQAHHNFKHNIVLSEAAQYWISSSFAKVCLQVKTEEELLEIEKKAKEAGLECHVVTDSGRTEFGGVPTKTCLAIGPDYVDKIDEITGGLDLY